ncbi:MAG: 30S ribosomal protein S12 methylthiotransferase RimO [Bacillota bacterium]
MKIGIVSLGCDKNRVDSERMISNLAKGGHELTNEESEADVLIVNTCAFIGSAREESVQTLFELAKYKNEGNCKKLIATGCLPQKYVKDIFDDFVEVDGFLGCKDYSEISTVIDELFEGEERINAVGRGEAEKKEDATAPQERVLTTPFHYAYLKIAEGCDNKCTYCTIPSIRGKYISEPMEKLIAEANRLADNDIKEIILVAQDVTSYGVDLYGEFKIVTLIKELSKIEGINWIRLLYCYPERITDELIEEIKTNDKVVKYLDIPLQHASTNVLKRMGRKGSYDQYITLFSKLKKEIPTLALRTTFMVGFPGESEEDFADLQKFLETVDILNCGVFKYSLEEDTPSAKLKGHLPEELKEERYNKILDYLEEKSHSLASGFVGKTLDVISDGIDYDKETFVGRGYLQAPDIDSQIFFTSEETVEVGGIYKVKITSTQANDLFGEVVE